MVLVAANPEDNGASAEHDGGKKPRAPEPDIFLNVDHGDLTGKGADVDEHVKVQKDTREGDIGIRDDTLASLLVDDHTRLGLLVLLGNKWGDVGLESTGTKSENNDAENERNDGVVASENVRDRTYDKEDVPYYGKCDRNEDGVEAAKVLISNDSTDDGCGVSPERVEGTNTEGRTLAHAETTRLTLSAGIFTSGLNNTVDDGQILLDKVGVYF